MTQSFFKAFFQKIKSFVVGHPWISTVGLLVILGAGYWGYGKLTSTAGETQYVLSSVQKGTIISTVTGSGQVSASNQIDVKSKASGDIVYVGVDNGQTVSAGTLLVQLDTRDAEKAVRDAEVNLQSAQIALQKLQQPADALSMTQAQNAVSQADGDLKKAYDDGFNTVSNTFLDLPSVMTGLQDVLYGNTVTKSGQDNISAYSDMVKNYDDRVLVYKDDTAAKFQAARTAYDTTFDEYKSATRFSDTQAIENLLDTTYDTTKTIAEAVKSANDLLNFVKDRLTEHQATIPAILTTHQNSLATYTSQTNGHLLDLFAIKNTIITSNLTLKEKTEALAKLQSGADPLDISSQQLTVKQRQNALLDAQEKLSDYYVRAPFDGTIAKIDVKKSDSLNAGAIAATLITKQQLAEVSLNEVDAAKIKVGQKVTLTFDAVDGLTITGKVAEIDAVGTVTQGVVTYTVQISFDTQDDRVKSGMSTSAAIITDMKQDVLTVPNSAVKMQGDTYYVDVFNPPLQASGNQAVASAVLPQQRTVEIGISNDTDTEIISGLKESDQVVTRTITPSTTATQTAPSLFPTGGNRGATGGTRAPTGR